MPPALSPSPAEELARACAALWAATLSLMTAYMQQSAPAHRCLIARRVAANLRTLSTQDCFEPHTRERFVKLSSRWQRNADRAMAGDAQPQGLTGRLRAVFGRI